MTPALRAYIDLMRLQFFFAWPLLFGSGYLLATMTYGGFSWLVLAKVALIGFTGFEAGLVLNDYIDRDLDKKEVEGRLTRYWRLSGTRPLPAGLIPPTHVLMLFLMCAGIAAALIVTLPYPHSVYVLLLAMYCYAMEIFYQKEKQIPQVFPFPQIFGRTDFALFPVAGYLCAGSADTTALLYFVFFYPFALAHLGVNDLIDEANDRARGLRTDLYFPGSAIEDRCASAHQQRNAHQECDSGDLSIVHRGNSWKIRPTKRLAGQGRWEADL